MYKVYWTYANESYGEVHMNLNDALKACEHLRKHGRSFVTMVSEDPNCVGKMGVDSIEEGMCPDGVEYTWRKRR